MKRTITLVILAMMVAACATPPPSASQCSGWLLRQPLPLINLQIPSITGGPIAVQAISPGSQMKVRLDDVLVYEGSGEGWLGSLTATEGQHQIRVEATQFLTPSKEFRLSECGTMPVTAWQTGQVFVDLTSPSISEASVFWEANTLTLIGKAVDNSGLPVMVMFYGAMATTNAEGMFRLEISWPQTMVPVMGIEVMDEVGNMSMADATLYLPPNRAEHYASNGALLEINTAMGFNPMSGLVNLFGFLDGSYWVVFMDNTPYIATTTSVHWLMRALSLAVILMPVILAIRRKFFPAQIIKAPQPMILRTEKHGNLAHLARLAAQHTDPLVRLNGLTALNRPDVPENPEGFPEWIDNVLPPYQKRAMYLLLELEPSPATILQKQEVLDENLVMV